jgi:hypothetical protein
MQCAATAGAGRVLDVDDLFDALKVSRQRTSVRFARRRSAWGRRDGLKACLDTAERRVEFLQRKLELVVIELLGPSAKPVSLERLDDGGETPNLGIRIGVGRRYRYDLGFQRDPLFFLRDDHRAERLHVVGEVSLKQHGGDGIRE